MLAFFTLAFDFGSALGAFSTKPLLLPFFLAIWQRKRQQNGVTDFDGRVSVTTDDYFNKTMGQFVVSF